MGWIWGRSFQMGKRPCCGPCSSCGTKVRAIFVCPQNCSGSTGAPSIVSRVDSPRVGSQGPCARLPTRHFARHFARAPRGVELTDLVAVEHRLGVAVHALHKAVKVVHVVVRPAGLRASARTENSFPGGASGSASGGASGGARQLGGGVDASPKSPWARPGRKLLPFADLPSCLSPRRVPVPPPTPAGTGAGGFFQGEVSAGGVSRKWRQTGQRREGISPPPPAPTAAAEAAGR
eukprot:CAMPEP_0172608944 /NCGR_PEP_ID=MMETSP1068-20121228/28980_1 /TAXON_ID=35684 /ORGANISM="Pseudopedinella elastica, Strain CCMP716" /LENGTH=233 /DNA_ID=CAMNT_0013412339 /DNA_START=164 /DNA_END=862 /DNA_ORIENTATION=-